MRVCVHQVVPVGLDVLVVPVALGGSAGEVVQGLAGDARLDVVVGVVDLGPGLLDDQHPELVAVAAREGGLLLGWVKGELVVDDHLAPLTEQAELDLRGD